MASLQDVPPLPIGVPIVDPQTGAASREFAIWWEKLFVNVDDVNEDVDGKADASTEIIAGAGLTGGGDLSEDRTLNVGAGTGITVNADDVAIDTATEAERIRDVIGSALVAGSNVTITVNDGADTITIAASGGGGGGGTKYIGYADFEAGVNRVITAGSWIGKFVVAPMDCTIDRMIFYSRATTGTVRFTPAIYQATSTGTMGSLLESGPTVVGVVPGLNEFPLTNPLSVSEGDLLYVGYICRTSNPTGAGTLEKGAAYFAAASDTPPTTPSGVTYGYQANWVACWAGLT